MFIKKGSISVYTYTHGVTMAISQCIQIMNVESDLVKGLCWAMNGFILDTNQVQKMMLVYI